MAVRKINRKKPWQCYWTNPFTAKQESAQFNTEREAQAHDSLIKHRLRFERENFRPKEEPELAGKMMTVEDLVFAHLSYKKPSKSNARRELNNLRPVLLELGRLPLCDLTKLHIMECMRAHSEKVKLATVRVRFAMLKSALNWGVTQGIIASFPAFKIPNPPHEKIPPPTPEECAAIIEHAASHVRRVILLGAYCGMRIGPSELFKLTWADVNFQQATLRVWSAQKNKSMPWRDVPLAANIYENLKEWHADDNGEGYIIHYHGNPVTSIKTAWRKALKRAGVTRRIRPYDLRHAFATNALAAGSDLKSVSEIMGHADSTMVLKVYQHVQEEQKKQTVNSLPAIRVLPEQKT